MDPMDQSIPLEGYIIMDTLAQANQTRIEQGQCETEISYGGEVDLHRHLVSCTKNPGHRNFVPVDEFNGDCLPPWYSDDTRKNLVNLTKDLSDLAVCVSVKHVSENRPVCFPNSDKPYPCYKNRGGNMMRTGTGIVNAVMRGHMSSYIHITTAAHVVFDELEAESTECHLFFDKGSALKFCNGVVTLGRRLMYKVTCNDIQDWCKIVYRTSDLALTDRLEKSLEHCKKHHSVPIQYKNDYVIDMTLLCARYKIHKAWLQIWDRISRTYALNILDLDINIRELLDRMRSAVDRLLDEARSNISSELRPSQTKISNVIIKTIYDIHNLILTQGRELQKTLFETTLTPQKYCSLGKLILTARSDIQILQRKASYDILSTAFQSDPDIKKLILQEEPQIVKVLTELQSQRKDTLYDLIYSIERCIFTEDTNNRRPPQQATAKTMLDMPSYELLSLILDTRLKIEEVMLQLQFKIESELLETKRPPWRISDSAASEEKSLPLEAQNIINTLLSTSTVEIENQLNLTYPLLNKLFKKEFKKEYTTLQIERYSTEVERVLRRALHSMESSLPQDRCNIERSSRQLLLETVSNISDVSSEVKDQVKELLLYTGFNLVCPALEEEKLQVWCNLMASLLVWCAEIKSSLLEWPGVMSSLLQSEMEINDSTYPENLRHKCAIIVSHPHGCSKQVSVGHVTNVDKIGDSGNQYTHTTYTYTTPTCLGSSGAYVCVLGRKHMGYLLFDLVHYGSSDKNNKLNYSVSGIN